MAGIDIDEICFDMQLFCCIQAVHSHGDNLVCKARLNRIRKKILIQMLDFRNPATLSWLMLNGSFPMVYCVNDSAFWETGSHVASGGSQPGSHLDDRFDSMPYN